MSWLKLPGKDISLTLFNEYLLRGWFSLHKKNKGGFLKILQEVNRARPEKGKQWLFPKTKAFINR